MKRPCTGGCRQRCVHKKRNSELLPRTFILLSVFLEFSSFSFFFDNVTNFLLLVLFVLSFILFQSWKHVYEKKDFDYFRNKFTTWKSKLVWLEIFFSCLFFAFFLSFLCFLCSFPFSFLPFVICFMYFLVRQLFSFVRFSLSYFFEMV